MRPDLTEHVRCCQIQHQNQIKDCVFFMWIHCQLLAHQAKLTKLCFADQSNKITAYLIQKEILWQDQFCLVLI